MVEYDKGKRQDQEGHHPKVGFLAGDTRVVPFIKSTLTLTTQGVDGCVLSIASAIAALTVTSGALNGGVLGFALVKVEPIVVGRSDRTFAFITDGVEGTVLAEILLRLIWLWGGVLTWVTPRATNGTHFIGKQRKDTRLALAAIGLGVVDERV